MESQAKIDPEQRNQKRIGATKAVMMVTVVRFAPIETSGGTGDRAAEIAAAERPTAETDFVAEFGANASRYLQSPGLLWKAYLISDDGNTVGGTYWWRDRASAEAAFNQEWLAGVTAKYGRAPTIEWFNAPVVVDVLAGAVRVDAPAAPTSPAPTSLAPAQGDRPENS